MKPLTAGMAKGAQIVYGLLHKGLHARLVAVALLLVNLLSSCSTDPYAGMEAARRMGQKECLAYSWKGHGETAAVFEFHGHTWVYHPTTGSAVIDGSDPLSIPGSVWTPVQCVHQDARLDGACLPLAIADVKQNGGRVVIAGHHAFRVP